MLLPYQPDYKQDQLKVPGTGACVAGTCNGQHSHQVTPLTVNVCEFLLLLITQSPSIYSEKSLINYFCYFAQTLGIDSFRVYANLSVALLLLPPLSRFVILLRYFVILREIIRWIAIFTIITIGIQLSWNEMTQFFFPFHSLLSLLFFHLNHYFFICFIYDHDRALFTVLRHWINWKGAIIKKSKECIVDHRCWWRRRWWWRILLYIFYDAFNASHSTYKHCVWS